MSGDRAVLGRRAATTVEEWAAACGVALNPVPGFEPSIADPPKPPNDVREVETYECPCCGEVGEWDTLDTGTAWECEECEEFHPTKAEAEACDHAGTGS